MDAGPRARISMTAPVFVDTNVLVYAHQENEPRKQPLAAHWLELLWRDRSGRTSVHVLNEYYVTLTRKIKPALSAGDAWDHVRNLLTWNPQPTDAELMLRAHEVEQRYRLSWWDSLIVGAAQLQNCAVLLTEDLQDHAIYGSVTIRNPFSMGVSENRAAYAVARAVTPAHPRRGRPRRPTRAA
jgi:predicted nucleic acid-binding protein